MQTNVRLIDANALKEAIRNIEFHCWDSFDDAIAYAVDAIDSAPTVETTDDVLSSLETLEKEMTLNYSNGEYSFKVIGSWYTSYSNSPLEALKKLEASLNPK